MLDELDDKPINESMTEPMPIANKPIKEVARENTKTCCMKDMPKAATVSYRPIK
jgi:hypothetical protein